MAFSNELIPEDAKKNLDFPVYKYADGGAPTLWQWTIDRERNACMIHTKTEGGSYEGVPKKEHMVLLWKGNNIFFKACPSNGTGIPLEGEIHYLIEDLDIPQALHAELPEVKKLIYEALATRGWLYSKKRFEVRVTFQNEA